MNQSYLEANKCKQWEARENAGEQVTMTSVSVLGPLIAWEKGARLAANLTNRNLVKIIRHSVSTFIWKLQHKLMHNVLLMDYGCHCINAKLQRAKYQCNKCYYYSFKIFPELWLAKSTGIIPHNQLLMTKFGRILRLMSRWRRKCSLLEG